MQKFKNFLKRQFKNNKNLYRFWFRFSTLNQKLSLPTRSHDFYFDGYPRSGNTFVSEYFKFFYPELKFSHHLHTKAALALATARKITSIIVFREPLEAISSYVVMQSFYKKGSLEDVDFIRNLVIEYNEYYRFAIKKSDNLTILEFKDIIDVQKLDCIISNCSTMFGKTKSNKQLSDFVQNFKNHQKNKKIKLTTSSPNVEKEKQKNKVKSVISSLGEYKLTEDIYSKCCQLKMTI